MSKLKYGNMHEKVFIASAIVFNILVSAVYVSTKFEQIELIKTISYPFVSLILPFAYTLYRFIQNKEGRRIIISNIVIIVYLFFELSLDVILGIPFREILWLHIFYILVFYAAEFSMLGISFNIDKKTGFSVLVSFIILIGCLIYLYLG